MSIQFVVHEEGDSVGVVVVEGVRADDRTISITARGDIPLGHKLAIRDLPVDGTVIKYGVDIGRAVAPIQAGEHLHVHNVRTKRW